ncbi:MAG: glutaredoxin domain-containing protein [Anaerolineaceae bacterium]
MTEEKQIRFFGTTWCGDCRRSKNVFAEMGISYLWFDVDQNKQAETFVKSANKGLCRVPTIVFPDGTILVEPSNPVLIDKLRQFQAQA